jgi:DUF971 family protein
MTASKQDAPAFIQKIKQLDAEQFQIDWSDGQSSTYRLAFLQENCPCVQCQGKGKVAEGGVKARRVHSVGRYALRVDFTSGCTNGIFDFPYLRRLAGLGA